MVSTTQERRRRKRARKRMEKVESQKLLKSNKMTTKYINKCYFKVVNKAIGLYAVDHEKE